MRTLLLSRDKILLIAKFGTILQEIIVFQVTKNDITSGGIFYIMFFNIFCVKKKHTLLTQEETHMKTLQSIHHEQEL